MSDPFQRYLFPVSQVRVLLDVFVCCEVITEDEEEEIRTSRLRALRTAMWCRVNFLCDGTQLVYQIQRVVRGEGVRQNAIPNAVVIARNTSCPA